MNFNSIDTMLFFNNKISDINALSLSTLNNVSILSLYQNRIKKRKENQCKQVVKK